ncbi:MAG: hypothetical protein IH582_05245, partial [Afipia sp.]|nr:hypothetical protein [Afipia sp.]
SWKTLLHCEKDPEAIKQCIRRNEHISITLYRDEMPAALAVPASLAIPTAPATLEPAPAWLAALDRCSRG